MNKNVLGSISFVTVFVLILFVMPATHDGVSEAEAYMTTDPLSPLRIQAKPTYPKPGENVQLSIRAGSMNLSSALITWRVNGTVVIQGYGASSYTLQTSLVGSTYTIEVTTQSPSGATLSGFINISVSDIAVVWEGSTYTPTLYKGRPMYSAGSLARVMAMPTVLDPNGRVYSPEELTYRWHVGGSRVAAHEGKGRYSVDLASDRPMQSIAAIVHVFDPAGNERIRQSINIPVRSPNLLYYVNDSTFGLLLERSLEGSYSMQQKEEVITAEPYHMNVRSRNDQGLRYEWRVGGNEVQAMGSILLSSEGTSVGSSRVTTRVVSSSQFLQSAQNELLVRFNDIDVSGPITTPL